MAKRIPRQSNISGAKEKDLHNLRHSYAHVLAAAVLELFPDAKFGVGPVIENGFFYDFQLPRALTPSDLPKLEKRMKQIIAQRREFKRQELSFADTKMFFKNKQQPFKVELVDDLEKKGTTYAGEGEEVGADNVTNEALEAGKVTIYSIGTFDDLCRGGHVQNTGDLNAEAFRLNKISGAYWRADQKNAQLQRVYGIAFTSKQELEEHQKLLEEAAKRDHRKIGQQLELFLFHETAPGMPYWLPNGMIMYNELVRFWREEHSARGYHEIVSPLLNKKELYVQSGHFAHYWKNMFVANMGKEEEYGVKAMNCPNAMIVFGCKPHSYRDLPLRLSDTDTLHRYEPSGTLNGLLRVREFRQDDAHIFVTEDQIEKEYEEIFAITKRFYGVFRMDYAYRLGTRPAKFVGDVSTWDRAEALLHTILKKSKKPFTVLEGDGAFYGPKVDIIMHDALGREWQMGTIQLDFQQPRQFDLQYTAQDGSPQTPVVIHRVIYGSLERFIGILIEHTTGNLPVWLSPVQVQIIPVSEKFSKAAQKLGMEIASTGIRVHVDDANESVGKKIRNSSIQKIPYVLVIGEKEAKAAKLTVRIRGTERLLEITKKQFVEKVQDELKNRQ